MKHPLILDIETAPLPEDKITFPEFKPPANYTDPAKIAANLAEQRTKFIERAALSATSGFVCAVGFMEEDELGDWEFSSQEHPISEAALLLAVWDKLKHPRTLVTFYGKNFDLPFLIRRSWILGIKVPSWLREGRYWSRDIIDVYEDWQLGDREMRGGLDLVSRIVLGRGKTGHGKDFWALLQANPLEALEYLAEDCALTKDLFVRIHGGAR